MQSCNLPRSICDVVEKKDLSVYLGFRNLRKINDAFFNDGVGAYDST